MYNFSEVQVNIGDIAHFFCFENVCHREQLKLMMMTGKQKIYQSAVFIQYSSNFISKKSIWDEWTYWAILFLDGMRISIRETWLL